MYVIQFLTGHEFLQRDELEKNRVTNGYSISEGYLPFPNAHSNKMTITIDINLVFKENNTALCS